MVMGGVDRADVGRVVDGLHEITDDEWRALIREHAG
jgi:hypothetical protein